MVFEKNQKEMEDWVAGPFKELFISVLKISPLGVVTKKFPEEYRLIFHLLYLLGALVDDNIQKQLATVYHTSFDDVVAMVTCCSWEALLGKNDIKSSFQLLPIFPSDFELLDFEFDISI